VPEEENAYCPAHSGMKTWISVGIGLLVALNGLVGYQVFIQVPDIKFDITRRIDMLENKTVTIEKDIVDLKETRNADHPSSLKVR
jgi:hypothetical protein